ncbi:MAG: STT3 domain-containing protein [Candidatus Undinarchaeales archaeon]|nr:STT3 domain-containing protein [Candidatus Undinarchaeales archaeon]
MAEGDKEEENVLHHGNLSVDTSFISNAKKEDKKPGEYVTVDFSKQTMWLKQNKKLLVYLALALLLIFSGYIRFKPEEKFTDGLEEGFSSTDSYWHYRHAKNVLDHGYVGDEIRLVDGKEVYWDTMHDAPFGSEIEQEFYPYFSAYSYKYLGQFFAPSLLVWHRWTPVFFGLLTILGAFLLIKELFNPIAGLASAFFYSTTALSIFKSVSGSADTDALIAFFTVFTFFFFALAWRKESWLYGAIGGVFLGMFGFAWSSYKFVPILILSYAFFFFIFNLGLNFKKLKKIPQLTIGHFKKHWKKYAILLLIFFIGFALIGFLKGVRHINIFSVLKTSTQLKAQEVVGSAGTEEIRTVYSTVDELSSMSFRKVIFILHIAPFLFISMFFALFLFNRKEFSSKYHSLFFLIFWTITVLFMSLKAMRFSIMLALPFSLLTGLAVSSFIKIKSKATILVIFILLFSILLFLPNLPQYQGAPAGPSYISSIFSTVSTAAPTFSQNWGSFFKWSRENTPEDAIFASWWDPGHAMTAIGERPSVADGSQNDYHVHDLAVAFTATDESVSVERLSKYNVSYFYTSVDLLSKYTSISFLNTGQSISYPYARLSEIQQSPSGGVYTYPLDSISTLLLNFNGESWTALIKQGPTTTEIKRLYYFVDESPYLSEKADAEPSDPLLIVSKSYGEIFILSGNLEKNLLTQLQFFNGQNLEHFEFVKDFGGEIKLFKFTS